MKIEPLLVMAGPNVNRKGKRLPSDCDGLTVAIVMMHLLCFSFSHYIGRFDEHFVIKDDPNEAFH